MCLLDTNYAVFVEWVKLDMKKHLTETFQSDLQKTKQTNKQKTLETDPSKDPSRENKDFTLIKLYPSPKLNTNHFVLSYPP